jgi:hypothetical protein
MMTQHGLNYGLADTVRGSGGDSNTDGCRRRCCRCRPYHRCCRYCHRHHHRPCRPRPCPFCCPPASSPSPSPTSSPLLSPSPSPSPSLPLLTRHHRRHRSCSHRHRPLCRTPPLSPYSGNTLRISFCSCLQVINQLDTASKSSFAKSGLGKK